MRLDVEFDDGVVEGGFVSGEDAVDESVLFGCVGWGGGGELGADMGGAAEC